MFSGDWGGGGGCSPRLFACLSSARRVHGPPNPSADDATTCGCSSLSPPSMASLVSPPEKDLVMDNLESSDRKLELLIELKLGDALENLVHKGEGQVGGGVACRRGDEGERGFALCVGYPRPEGRVAHPPAFSGAVTG